jgi:hypothetical protein
MIVKESISFQRGMDPKDVLGIGPRYIIERWLDEMSIIDRCVINNDMTIDCINYVRLANRNLVKLPDYIQFNIAESHFDVSENKLISLRGCPYIVKGFFACNHNKLTSLEGCPKEVNETFFCGYNSRKFSKEEVKEHCKTTSDHFINN